MSNSVVPAAAVAHAKQLVRNKKLVKRTEDQKPAQDEQQATDKDEDAAHVAKPEQKSSMSDTSLSGNFSFAGALSAAADSASLAAETAQDEGGSSSDDSDGGGVGGTVLLVGAVGLAGLGVAVLAGGGGGSKNEAPAITSGATATVAENEPATKVVYQATATDADGDVLSYSLTGADAAAFNISSTGAVTLKNPADFEAKSSYTFNVVVTDPGGLTATKAVTLTVTNVDEAPVITSAATATVAENAPVDTVVYQAAATDPEGKPVTYVLSGADAALLSISATGAVTLKASADFESKTAYNFTITASDGTLTSSKDVVLSVTNVNETPFLNDETTLAFNVQEGGSFEFVIDADDPDGDALTATIVTAPTRGTIDLATNTYTATGEAGPDSFVVRVSDPGGKFVEYTVNVTVGPDVAEFSLDIVGDTSTEPALVDASDDLYVFTEDAAKNTDVIITGFSNDDVINVLNATADQYNFGTGEDPNDLLITFVNSSAGTSNIILIDDVLDGSVFVTDYASAVEAVGFNFMNFA